MTAELLMRRLVHQGRQQSIVAVFAVVLAVILTGAASCSRDGDSRIPSGAIVRVGDSWLTRSDLRQSEIRSCLYCRMGRFPPDLGTRIFGC